MLHFLRRCVTTLVGSDDKDVRVQQVGYNGAAVDAEVYAPYGMSYNLPPGCLCLYAQVGGDGGNLVVLPDRSQDRVRDLAEGEVAFFNPLTKSRTVYRQDGTLEIVTEGNAGHLSVTVKGNVSLSAQQVDIDAAVTNIGVGGQAIARVGDSVEVNVVGGSSAGTHSGTITSGGSNTSI